MSMASRLTLICAAFALGAVAAGAEAQTYTYRCKGKDGKKYYASAIPPQCIGEPIEVVNDKGFVVKRIDQGAEQRERAAKSGDVAKSPEELAAERSRERQDRALLATYTSTKDIDDARARALKENAQQASRFEQKITELQTRRGRYEKELETYQKENKGGTSKVISDNINNVELEIQVQQQLLATKKKEVDTINAKYDAEKQRYGEAKARGSAK
jgi:hypothetical protein